MKSKCSQNAIVMLLLFVLVSGTYAQQNLPIVRPSPQARVFQAVGFAEIEINYSRPGVKGREIWGKLVPYGLAPTRWGNARPMPWRAGANENTTISLSHDAQINGNPLPAGTYGFHIIVQEDEWTLIFSKDHNAWGSFFYEEKNDALRINVIPSEAGHQEWLLYGFDNLTSSSCDAFLHWENLKAVFTIEFDQHEIVLDRYRELLTFMPGFYQQVWTRAARYCLQNEINPDEAITWIEKAMSLYEGDNFYNMTVKAELLTLKGQTQEGDKLLESAVEAGTEEELNAYGYQLMNRDRLDEAIEIFEINIKKFPDSWNVYDSLGEALANKGDTKGAREYYEKALTMAPEEEKARIEGILKNL